MLGFKSLHARETNLDVSQILGIIFVDPWFIIHVTNYCSHIRTAETRYFASSFSYYLFNIKIGIFWCSI